MVLLNDIDGLLKLLLELRCTPNLSYMSREEITREFRTCDFSYPRRSGKTTALVKLYHELRDRNFDVIVVTHSYFMGEPFRKAGIPLTTLGNQRDPLFFHRLKPFDFVLYDEAKVVQEVASHVHFRLGTN